MPQLEVIDDNRFRDEYSFAPPFQPAPVRVPAPAPPRERAPAPKPKPSAASRLAQGAARLANRLLIALTPMNSGPEGTGNLFGGPGALYGPHNPPPPLPLPSLPDPEPLLELEPVYITPPPRRPTRVDAAPDEINPPNWWEIATDRPGETFRDWNRIIDTAVRIGRRAYDTFDFLSGLADRQAPQPLGSAGELPLPSGPVVFPELEPGVFTAPATRPGPSRVLPDPFGVPDPLRIGSPGFDPLPSTRTRPGTRPGTRPATRTPADPAGPLSPFFQLPANYRPARPGPKLPNFLKDPNPSLLEDPIGDRFEDPLEDPLQSPQADPCRCDKEPKKKKPKRKPRDVCKQGTYTQRAKGIKYAPKRTVPCEGEIEPEQKKSKPKTRRPLPGQFPL